MQCDFIIKNLDFPNIKECKICGRIVESKNSPIDIHAKCKKQILHTTTKIFVDIIDECKQKNDEQLMKDIADKLLIDIQTKHKQQENTAMPSYGTMAKNAFKAIGAFIANPTTVTKEEYEERLTICSSCDKYDDVGNRCGMCGCFLAAKAKGAAFHCPLKKWPGDT